MEPFNNTNLLTVKRSPMCSGSRSVRCTKDNLYGSEKERSIVPGLVGLGFGLAPHRIVSFRSVYTIIVYKAGLGFEFEQLIYEIILQSYYYLLRPTSF